MFSMFLALEDNFAYYSIPWSGKDERQIATTEDYSCLKLVWSLAELAIFVSDHLQHIKTNSTTIAA